MVPRGLQGQEGTGRAGTGDHNMMSWSVESCWGPGCHVGRKRGLWSPWVGSGQDCEDRQLGSLDMQVAQWGAVSLVEVELWGLGGR